MALYNRTQLDPNASIMSPGYAKAAFQHYSADLEPMRRQAINELTDEYSTRGLQGGGQQVRALATNRGNILQQLAQKRQAIGMLQANAGEQNRESLEGRQWQLQDIAGQNALEDEMRGWDAADYQTARRARPMKILFGGIGKLAGAGAASLYKPSSDNQLAPTEKAPAPRVNY